MAVYQCQCDLILSTPDRNAHCPRCGHPLVEGDRLFLGSQTPAAPNREDQPATLDSAEPASPPVIVPHSLYGYGFAIAHIRAIGQAWLGS